MLYYCGFTWHHHTTRQQVAQRILQQHDSGAEIKQHLKGWYNLVGGGAGFLLVEVDDPRRLTAALQPYMDLMSFDVRACYALNYDEQIQELRKVAQTASAR